MNDTTAPTKLGAKQTILMGEIINLLRQEKLFGGFVDVVVVSSLSLAWGEKK